MTADSISVIIPARDKATTITRCVGSVVAAAERSPGTELVLVENGSRDGTAALARELFGACLTIIPSRAGTAGEARNEGVRASKGASLCFLDADVVVPLDFFERLTRLLARFDGGAVGCTVSLPVDQSWIERTWGQLHDRGISGPTALLNGACMALSRAAFESVGGFRPELTTGEDADLCLRLEEAGVTLFESQELRVLHVDNPRTLGEFFRKEAWRGLGALATVRRDRLDRPATLTLLHGLLLGIAVIIAIVSRLDLKSLLVALAMTQAVPLLAVAFRMAVAERPPSFLASLALYQTYFLARFWALIRIASSRSGKSRA